MRRLLALPLLALAQPLHAQGLVVSPMFGTEWRYEQYATDRLLSANDGFQFRAKPGVALSSGPWSVNAVSDAAVAVRRSDGTAATAATTPMRPDAVQLGEFKLEYHGLPSTAISVGRQELGIAGASITGDRDGEQTFDAARFKWNGIGGISADFAYAWSSSSLWATAGSPLPASVSGDNMFAQLNWTSHLGTLSGYAYQIDQRDTTDSQFRLLNQVYGARFTGSRNINEDIKLSYSLGFVRQTGSLANPAVGAPTYWQIGNRFDFTDLTATQTSYHRFAANSISTLNGDTVSLATSATKGRLTLGAAFNDFRPVADTGSVPAKDVRVKMGLAF